MATKTEGEREFRTQPRRRRTPREKEAFPWSLGIRTLFATPEALSAGKNVVPTALLVEGGGSLGESTRTARAKRTDTASRRRASAADRRTPNRASN